MNYMLDKLKPCPNCKSNNGQAIVSRKYNNGLFSATDCLIRCDDCKYEINGYVTEIAAIKAWNMIKR